MTLSNYHGAAWHDLILNGAAIPNLADDAGTAPLTSLYAALHTAAPGAGGDQTTSEVAYTGYARVAVPRDGTGWTVADLVATLANAIDFPQATGGSVTATHFSLGTDASGAGNVLYFGALKDSGGSDTSLAISENITPQVPAGATITLS
jgi:hypothetical protein